MSHTKHLLVCVITAVIFPVLRMLWRSPGPAWELVEDISTVYGRLNSQMLRRVLVLTIIIHIHVVLSASALRLTAVEI